MAKGVVNNYGWWEGQVEIIHDGKTFYTPQLCRTILKPTPQHVNTIVTPPPHCIPCHTIDMHI